MFISLFTQHNKKELYKSHEYYYTILFLFCYTNNADIIYKYLPETYLPETF